MRISGLSGIVVVAFIITDQFYTEVNYRMLAIAASILVLVWADFKHLLIRQYVCLVRAVRFLFTPSKHF
ncbi:MAG: hypothetical protein H6Q72_474 [Firmicutes bacterium]|nr:hypothetical protein [Bacillota bacterium]